MGRCNVSIKCNNNNNFANINSSINGSITNINSINTSSIIHTNSSTVNHQANNSISIICIRVDFNLGNSNCITNFNQEATNKGINMVTKMMAMVITTMGG